MSKCTWIGGESFWVGCYAFALSSQVHLYAISILVSYSYKALPVSI